MSSTFEETPLYRFFKVILFLAYTSVVLIAIGAGIIGYGERKVTSVTVKCKDGTTWNAETIRYDSYALCGICKNRSADGTKYLPCTYQNMDYSSYTTQITREAWSWSTIIYPLIVFSLGFGLIDAVKLIVLYVFSGKIALEKSALLRVLVFLLSDNKANSQ